MARDDLPPYRVDHRECHCDKIPKSVVFEWVKDERNDPKGEAQSADYEPTVAKYEAPNWFEAHVALDYLDVVETRGDDYSVRWALIKAFGVDGWNALRSPGMNSEVFYKVLGETLNRIRGSLRPGGPKA